MAGRRRGRLKKAEEKRSGTTSTDPLSFLCVCVCSLEVLRRRLHSPWQLAGSCSSSVGTRTPCHPIHSLFAFNGLLSQLRHFCSSLKNRDALPFWPHTHSYMHPFSPSPFLCIPPSFFFYCLSPERKRKHVLLFFLM